MENKPINKLTMYLAVAGICDGNNSVWQSLQGFADAYADFKTRTARIQALLQNPVLDADDPKQTSQMNMCRLTLLVADVIHIYAIKTKNDPVAMETNLSMSSLMTGEVSESAMRCQNIHDLAKANLAILTDYGITAAKLTVLADAINSCNLFIRAARVAGKTIADNIQAEFASADKDLAVMDKLVGQFSANRKFGNDYNNARKILEVNPSPNHQMSRARV